MRKIVLLFIVLYLVCSLPAARKALVIGNGEYTQKSFAKLNNPVNDAADMDATLTRLGYQVTRLTNASYGTMDEKITEFCAGLSNQDEVLFYYSGHGVQVSGENYLIPVDANIAKEADCKYKAIKADWILESLADAKVCILVLDACRNNSLARGSRGMAVMNPSKDNQIIIFATKSGETASDGEGRNSPFASAFMEEISTSAKPVQNLMTDVKAKVKAMTGNLQVPDMNGILDYPYYFKINDKGILNEEKLFTEFNQKKEGNIVVYKEIWKDNFDSNEVNTKLKEWSISGNSSGVIVTGDNYSSYPYSLSMSGVSGGNWEAIATRQFEAEHNVYRFDFKFFFAEKGNVGSHKYHGFVCLRNSPSWTSSTQRNLLSFHPNGSIMVYYSGKEHVIGTYSSKRWISVSIIYQIGSQVNTDYYINGQLVHQGSDLLLGTETNFNYLSLGSGDTSCFFDDVSVSYNQ